MKKLSTAVLILFVTLCTYNLNAQVNFGVGLSAILEGNSALGVQGRALYAVSEDVDLSGQFTYYFEEFTDYALDFNAQYELLTIGDNITFAPLAGINILRVSVLGVGATNSSVQIGGVFTIPTDGLTFYAEPKIILDGSAFVIAGGIMF